VRAWFLNIEGGDAKFNHFRNTLWPDWEAALPTLPTL